MTKDDAAAKSDRAAEPKTAGPKAAEPKTAEPKTAEPKPAEAKAAEPKPAAAKATEPKPDKAGKPDKKGERKPETQVPKRHETAAPGKRLFVEPSLHAIDALDAETVAIGLCSDVRPLAGAAGFIDWRMCGHLTDLLRRGVVSGAAGEKVLLPTHGMIPPIRIFVFGWGSKRSLLDNAVARLAWMADVLGKAGVQRVAVALPEPAGILVGLVEEHLRKPLGDKLGVVFAPDELMTDGKDTRPIPAAPPAFPATS